jgi:hypothetical protein
MNPTLEVHYIDQHGSQRTVEIQGWEQARKTARELSTQSGRRAIIRRAPSRPWRLYVIRLADRKIIKTEMRLTKREAIEFWRQWNSKSNGGICVFWPIWAQRTHYGLGKSESK